MEENNNNKKINLMDKTNQITLQTTRDAKLMWCSFVVLSVDLICPTQIYKENAKPNINTLTRFYSQFYCCTYI